MRWFVPVRVQPQLIRLLVDIFCRAHARANTHNSRSLAHLRVVPGRIGQSKPQHKQGKRSSGFDRQRPHDKNCSLRRQPVYVFNSTALITDLCVCLLSFVACFVGYVPGVVLEVVELLLCSANCHPSMTLSLPLLLMLLQLVVGAVILFTK